MAAQGSQQVLESIASTVPSAAEVARLAAELRGASPEHVMRWTVERFPRTALTVSFGGGGLVLAHLLSRVDARVPVLFLDTGFHFPETLAFRAQFATAYGLTVVDLKPATDPGPLYQTDPDRCCQIRKVEPLRHALVGFDAWISGVRSEQSSARATIDVLERHESDGRAILKVFPLAGWSRDEVWGYIREHGLPYHPLLDQGYTSIGCWPCTRPTQIGESERAGRWAGTGKTECGLHLFTTKQ
ncbi:MAG TPA: phosphoadenylyl-sulfate reductase [Gemmatimonadales bacterium]|nr:phosphoadenylyl-sulfate reductase [Gemmatimonadales bacterium]